MYGPVGMAERQGRSARPTPVDGDADTLWEDFRGDESGVMASVGKVYLVGAGPGDPGLLTLRGLECLRRADLVLYDGLVNPILLRHTQAKAERTCRVSQGLERRLDQQEINQRLISAACAGRTVVRLKGGDPFVFGRGSEEAAALAEAGIPFEVVPGVTAAVAAGEYAGFSLTHREHSSAVAFITGHEDPTKESPSLDYQVLAQFPGTLVFYMGWHRLAQIAAALTAAGKSAKTPVAVISRATWPSQVTVTGSLETIAADVESAGLRPPSLIVVGDCVRQRDQIAWFEKRPLFGRSIGITRADEQADETLSLIAELGAEPVLMPTLELQPPESWTSVDNTCQRIGEFDWIVFTSSNGVRALFRRIWELGGDLRWLKGAQIAAIGASTAATLNEHQLRADVVPDNFRAEELAVALGGRVAGQKVLWVRADRARDVLRTELTAAGAWLEEIVVYRHHDVDAWSPEIQQRLVAGNLDWIGVSSPAIARNVWRLMPDAARSKVGQEIRIASISPVTSAACREIGLPVSAEAVEFTWKGIVAAIQNAETETLAEFRL
jgi:uroporphyrinogen III methyltransferase/synthase